MTRAIAGSCLMLFVSFLAACAGGPSPQSHPWSVRGHGMYTNPDDNQVFESLGGGLGAAVRFTNHFSLEANVTQTQAEWDVVQDGEDRDASVNHTIGNAILKFHLTERTPFMPYIGAGPNYVVYSGEHASSDSTLEDFEIENTAGWTAVAGARTYLGSRVPDDEWSNWYSFFEVWKLFNEVEDPEEDPGTQVNYDKANDGWYFVIGVSKHF